MPGSAETLLELLQQRKLLPQNMIDGLRRQVAELPDEITAHHVAKLLQRKGKITAFQARDLLAEVVGSEGEAPEPSAAPTSDKTSDSPATPDDELGLAEDEEDTRQQRRTRIPASSAEETRETPPTPASTPVIETPASLGGGLDDLLDDPLMQSTAAESDPLLLAPKKRKGWSVFGGGTKRGKRQAAGWDSPLIIVGGGILLLLLLLGGALAFILTRGSGDELFAVAERDYLDGAYAQSINKYEKFTARHSSHPKASLARVRIGLAKVRMASGGEDWQAALETAQTVLPTIEGEPAFDLARPELAALLPEIAQGFAEQASSQEDLSAAATGVDKFHEAMELLDNAAYLPASQRATLTTRLEKSAEQIAVVVRKIEEQTRLTETVARIESLVGEGHPMEAFAQRDALLQRYPRLHDQPSLVAAIGTVSAALVEHVAVDKKRIAAIAEDRPSPVIAEVVPARASGNRVDTLQGHVATMVIDGVLYALSADEGLLLWRRFVGQDTSEVLPVDASAGADLLVVDSQHHDLLRLSAANGQLVWRLPVGKPFAVVPAAEGRLLLTIYEGELWEVATKSGESTRQVQFPQPLATATVGSERGRLFVIGEDSNVYVLDDGSLRCLGVYYLGHQRATIRHRPTAVAGMLLVPHHVSLRSSLLHVLREVDDAPMLELAQSPATLEGHFAVPLVQQQLRLAAINQAGAVSLLAVDPADEDEPLASIAEKSGAASGGVARLAVTDDYLLAAHDGLSAYRLTTARGALTPRWVNHKGDTFVGSLQVIGSHVIHARRRPNQAGVVFAATARDASNAQDAGRPAWQTTIAPGVPKTSMSTSHDGQRLLAYCATGDRYEFPAATAASSALNTPAVAADRPGDHSEVVKLPDGRAMLIGQANGIVIIGEGPPWPGASAAPLAVAEFSAAAPWRGGLLAPTSLGQVVFLPTSPQTQAIHPFQPRLIVGETPRWLRPVAVSEDKALVANRAGDVHLVGIAREGAPHLASAAHVRLPHPPASPPALLGQIALVITRDQSGDALQRITLPELKLSDAVALPGRLRWGPHPVDDMLLLASVPGGLQAYTYDAALLWSYDLGGELPIGTAASDSDSLIVATSSGSMIRLGRSDGKELRRIRLAQPLAEGPLVTGNRIALRAIDGTILLITNE